MDYGQFREFFEQNYYYFLMGQLIFGLIIGAIPLLIGIKKQQRNLGLIALATCVLLALVSPLISLIVAVVFVIYMLRKKKPDA
jgi:multisubunit Na+/H+ antiporter MnhE subunit